MSHDVLNRGVLNRDAMKRTIIAPPRPDAPRRAPIYFIRHGETDWNREGRLQGQRDIPLNDLGRRQACEVALHLRDTIGGKVEILPWLVSPMGRVMETMQIVRRTLGLPVDGVTIDPRLIELGFGRWEGMTWKEVTRADPAGAAVRRNNKWDCVPPGGESYLMLLDRIRPVIHGMAGETIVVAHGGIARAFLVELAGVDGLEATTMDIWQGRLLVFENGGAHWVP